ncbi:hypothetical protein QO003_002046 [Arthrobacter silviterrae]|uniref:Uncharacterized protein n=1 Tax=Arthrobacter silviterrae TaxID=2026658 RepID=A0ABX0DDI1_9MICC|nr:MULTISPECIES: hypothetical protein [Arthrobacter]MCU6482420.1 hypothetical protein [Arthrobacter sp. A2-55]MDQ0277743.1 hypothetical protein [Arthrobacter silviterrae]NGN84988.1 hypothetical protein [Arthrobacter silviterrae]
MEAGSAQSTITSADPAPAAWKESAEHSFAADPAAPPEAPADELAPAELARAASGRHGPGAPSGKGAEHAGLEGFGTDRARATPGVPGRP